MITERCLFLCFRLLSTDCHLQNPKKNERTARSHSRKEPGYEILAAYTTCIHPVCVFSTVGDIVSTVGDIMSTMGYVQYRGGYHDKCYGIAFLLRLVPTLCIGMQHIAVT